jgi:uroporphyrinogen-III synthase
MTQRVLYLGLRVPKELAGTVTHYPIIQTEPLSLRPCLDRWDSYTHLLFTSQTSVELLRPQTSFVGKQLIAVGKKTAALLSNPLIAEEETAEGVCELLAKLDLQDSLLLWPHSKRARTVIPNYLTEHNVAFDAFPIYTTTACKPGPVPNLEDFDAVYFTSPSTVDAFKKTWWQWPKELELRAIGPITEKQLKSLKANQL